MQNQLYDRDFNLWVEQMAIAVINKDIEFEIPQDSFIDLKQILEKDYFG